MFGWIVIILLTSDSFHLIFPPSFLPPPSSRNPLVASFKNSLVAPSLPCVHIHLISSDWERHLWSSKLFFLTHICSLHCSVESLKRRQKTRAIKATPLTQSSGFCLFFLNTLCSIAFCRHESGIHWSFLPFLTNFISYWCWICLNWCTI